MTLLYIMIGVVVLGLIFLIAVYNSLIRSRNRVDEAWSDIDVQTKRRYDLIPNLVNTVKGYATHEKELFEKVTQARADAINATGTQDKAQAENVLTGALRSVFAVAENYPDLKASENFQSLQDEVTDTENKIMAARRFYNGNVRDFNTKLQVFPTNMFASILGFKAREFFELDESDLAAKQPVDVAF